MVRESNEYRLLIAMVVILNSVNLRICQAKESPNNKVDYLAEMNKLGKANRSDDGNAASYYEKAFKLCVEQPDEIKNLDRKIWIGDLSPEQQSMLRTWVQENSKALTEIKNGTQKPYYWAEYKGSSMLDVMLPDLRKTRCLAYALLWRAKFNVMKGNLKVAFSNILTFYRFGMHLTGPKNLVEQLIGISIKALAVETALEILDKAKQDPVLLRSFQRTLEVLCAKQNHFIDFTFERLLTYDIIQRIFTDDGKGGGHIYGTRPGEDTSYLKSLFGTELTEEQIKEFGDIEREQTTDLANRIFEYLNSAIHKTPYQLHNNGMDPQNVLEEMTKKNIFLKMSTTSFGRVLQIYFQGKIQAEALVATIAIFRYKADKGEYPNTLQELVSAEYLKELPRDPFSERSLVYKHFGSNFKLYSLGPDFDDDEGKKSFQIGKTADGDYVFWPVKP